MKVKIALKADEKPKEYSIHRFEKIFEIIYAKELLFNDWLTEQWIRNKCATAYKKGKIGQLALWLGKFHNKELLQHTIPDVAIQWIHEKIGYGLFAQHQFKKWQYIGEYTGILRRRNLLFSNINDYCFMYPREWSALKSYTIDSERCGNYTRFINHSDDPNCESISIYYKGIFHIIFRTIKEIQLGEELVYDYGGIYWLRRKKLNVGEFAESMS